ncbi:hypothetical protein EOL70_16790 [Leucothrix sargassi]|nr:hypothetical protein EOL70_16790 [Leucothrix sargassi]
MNVLAEFHYLVGTYRRRRGHYNTNTLEHLQKAQALSNRASHLIAYSYLKRDIDGCISQELLHKLTKSLSTSLTSNHHKRIYSLIREANSTNHSQSALTTAHSDRFTLDDFQLKQQAWRSELGNYLRKKLVAVVGNSASILDTNQGLNIDCFDVVCRFNHYARSTSYQKDAGKRVDIWVASAEALNERPQLPDSVRWIILTGADARYTLLNHKSCKHYLDQGKKIITIPLSTWSECVRLLEAPPSAGFLWLSYIQKHTSPQQPIHTFGFDSAQSTTSQYHASSSSFSPSKRHAWTKEKEALQALASDGTLHTVAGEVFAAFTKGLIKNNNLKKLLKSQNIIYKPTKKQNIDAVIGWGRKSNTEQAKAFASRHNTPYITLEDGFIHSMSQGRLGAHSWSLVIDKKGIFYDATQPSDLEELINATQLTSEQLARAKSCIQLITFNDITKYNNAPLVLPDYIKRFHNPILVLDQVDGDMSIPYSMASKASFESMLEAAIKENPDASILVKRHPDVINGKRKGCIFLPEPLPKNIHLINDNINSLVLMKHVSKVYVVSSQAGFEGLLLGKEVICFGAPFYAGWGLTTDRFDKTLSVAKRRESGANLFTVFYCAYILYSRYLHPVTQRPCEIEPVLEYVKSQYSQYLKNSGQLICFGLTPWKRKFIKHFLKSNDNRIYFVKNIKESEALNIDQDSKLIIWSGRHEQLVSELANKTGASVIKVEDGFLRSVNLGSNYSLPSSIVFDDKGIYFDPTKASRLEVLLNRGSYNQEKLDRAKLLREKIISLGISKYNPGSQAKYSLHQCEENKVVVLVPGQVADDASIKLGCVDIKTNLDLLKTTRQAKPDAYIIFKPHPDVVSDNRAGAIREEEALKYCDKVETKHSLANCLAVADEVHTLTSLVGFEALMRGITVYCYGLPFYSNWGLTHDRHTIERRQRKLTIDELTAATLIDYPTYFDWETKQFTSPEVVVEKLHQQSQASTRKKSQSIYTQKIAKYLNLFRALFTPHIR